ncbi:hypothetical protein TNCT_4211, partial [Trichonephila clavata]
LRQHSTMQQMKLQMLFVMSKVQFHPMYIGKISIQLILDSTVLLLCNFQKKMTTTYPSNNHLRRCLKTGPQNRILKRFLNKI